ncbi:hypothetical protein TCAL_07456 [Tigriopus californicus]|uniref:Sulfotransferase domain-containing protein n=2 Tax=Tigriopus californicus TaxID=6832 RepID=A0A553N753_TIGCA|nr:hypothetical protein TCAL_07456 [Tigriopus californicus]|eukprot:TCALIF_07456-PA protein Name:"Similar to GAL3ST1 Galactosylceramide sulfotransferase (Bos taurus)" AED:0.05 eAED:0.05 QI:0/-1/0/1/-1/1/1/0/381
MIGFVLISTNIGIKNVPNGATYYKTLERQLQQLQERFDGLAVVDEDSKCSPTKSVAFAKTHKTGSSTLQNILFRYGVQHELNFALPKGGWMFSFKEPFNADMVLEGPFKGLDFNLFAFHSVWNYAQMQRVLPHAKYLTLLRDPTECFESNYVYMGLSAVYKMDFNEFAQKKALAGLVRKPKSIIGKNQQLWDLGLNDTAMENRTLVMQKIRDLDRQMDLVLIMERFDESLVLLSDLLCWPIDELSYLKQNERITTKKTNITQETRKIMRKWLWADYMLYDYFKAELNTKLRKLKSDYVRQRLQELSAAKNMVTRACVIQKSDNSKLTGEFKMALPIVLGYVIDETKPWCAIFARSEPNFSKQIRDYQELKLKGEQLKGKIP